MGNSSQKWRFCYFVLIAITFSFQLAFCIPTERRGVRDHELPRSNRPAIPFDRGYQRYCLTRLKDALKLACSGGSNRNPLYYNPGHISHLNQNQGAVAQVLQGHSGMNDKPAMADPQTRLQRRRARRNIVRECCETPCNVTTLLKYCSPGTKYPMSFLDPSHSKSSLATSLKVKIGRLSRNPNIVTLQDQPNCLGYPDCNNIPNEQIYARLPTPPQCVSIADLEQLYLKLFHKQWKKDDTQTQNPNNNVNPAFADPVYNDNAVGQLDEESTKALAILTNQMFPNHFPNPILKYDISDWQPQSSTTTEKISVPEVRDEIKSEEKPEPQPTDERWSPNAITLKPITSIINLPLGYNDYTY